MTGHAADPRRRSRPWGELGRSVTSARTAARELDALSGELTRLLRVFTG